MIRLITQSLGGLPTQNNQFNFYLILRTGIYIHTDPCPIRGVIRAVNFGQYLLFVLIPYFFSSFLVVCYLAFFLSLLKEAAN